MISCTLSTSAFNFTSRGVAKLSLGESSHVYIPSHAPGQHVLFSRFVAAANIFTVGLRNMSLFAIDRSRDDLAVAGPDDPYLNSSESLAAATAGKRPVVKGIR